jgi:hypothetical protein
MSFNICRGTFGSLAMLAAIRRAVHCRRHVRREVADIDLGPVRTVSPFNYVIVVAAFLMALDVQI